ncbi:MAG: DUF4349 domain-containing protein [Lachnospirales bacterium]
MCEEYLDIISMYIDGKLNEKEKEDLLAHLATCSGCTNYYNMLLEIKDDFATLDAVEIPDNFHETMMLKVKEEIKNSRKQKKWKINFNIPAYAASFIVSLLVLFPVFNIINTQIQKGKNIEQQNYNTVSSINNDTPEMQPKVSKAAPRQSLMLASPAPYKYTGSTQMRSATIEMNINNTQDFVQYLQSMYKISNMNFQNNKNSFASLTINTTADAFQETYDSIIETYTTNHHNLNVTDYSQDVQDLETRIDVNMQTLQKYMALLDKAKTNKDILTIENYVYSLENTMQSDIMEFNDLISQLENPTIQLSIYQNTNEQNFYNGFTSSINLVTNLLGTFYYTLVFLSIPLLIVLAVILCIIVIKNRRKL